MSLLTNRPHIVHKMQANKRQHLVSKCYLEAWIDPATAGKVWVFFEARMLKAPRSGGRWTMIVGPARSEESTNVGQVLIGQFKGLADAEHAARVRLSDPMAFVMVDISAITERITAALENDDGQTEAA
jgi:hypothetical protein